MNEINKLRVALSQHLSWHGARITFLALFLVALFRVRTVNQAELASAFASRTKSESDRKRLKRFFSQFEVDEEKIARMLVGLAGIPEPKLFALLAIAFTWAMRAGLWLHERQPLKLKSHGRREQSLFRLGLDFLRRLCLDFPLHRSDFRRALQLLSLY